MVRFVYLQQPRRLFKNCLAAIALGATIVFVPDASAKLFDGPVDRLPAIERDALRQGRVILNGEKGKYTARILVKGSMDTAWEVLTDYENFQQFLPNITSSQLIENNGDRKVFEQVNRVRVLVFNKQSRIRLAITETYPQQIAFSLVEGDLKSLEGFWQLEPVSPYPSAPPDRVLITQQVDVASDSGGSIFYSIFEDALKKTLAAIEQEVKQRSNPHEANAFEKQRRRASILPR
ncbi:SRPBCC family protein [Pleurocapsales cyanobacterium LEGE 06147]|nr:SRPBCC family protein [Pleurocapsales cyanobacterium LEGE 06147]